MTQDPYLTRLLAIVSRRDPFLGPTTTQRGVVSQLRTLAEPPPHAELTAQRRQTLENAAPAQRARDTAEISIKPGLLSRPNRAPASRAVAILLSTAAVLACIAAVATTTRNGASSPAPRPGRVPSPASTMPTPSVAPSPSGTTPQVNLVPVTDRDGMTVRVPASWDYNPIDDYPVGGLASDPASRTRSVQFGKRDFPGGSIADMFRQAFPGADIRTIAFGTSKQAIDMELPPGDNRPHRTRERHWVMNGTEYFVILKSDEAHWDETEWMFEPIASSATPR